MRIFVRILSIAGILFIALIVAGFVVLSFMDFNQYKDKLTQGVKEATGREMTIAGDFDVEFSLTPRIAVGGVSFANAPWGSKPEMISVRRFVVEMSLLPLLTGEMRIRTLILEDVDVLMEKNSEGVANWDFAGKGWGDYGDYGGDEERGYDDRDIRLPTIENLLIKNVRLTYVDAQAGTRSHIVLNAADIRPGKGFTSAVNLDVAGTLNGQELVVTGRVLMRDADKLVADPITVGFAGAELKGGVVVDFTNRLPRLDATFSVAHLDAGKLLSGAESEAKKDDDARLFPSTPIAFEALRAFTAKIKLDVGRLMLRGVEISNLNVLVTLEDGTLNIDPLSAELGGGQLTASLSATAQGDVEATLDVKQVDYGLVLKQRGLGNIVAGKADAQVHVEGQGTSVRQIMAGLNGKIRVSTQNGLLNEGGALPDIFGTDRNIVCGVVDFDITGGQAQAHAIVLETGAISVLGGGGANLADESLDLRLIPHAKTPNFVSAFLAPVVIDGHFAKPEWHVDAAAIAGKAAKTVGAFATMGLSLLAETLVDVVVESGRPDYCALALAGKKVAPDS